MEMDLSLHTTQPRTGDEQAVFWQKQADYLDWISPHTTLSHTDYAAGHIRWFEGALLNLSVNCLDRHLPHLNDKVAFYYHVAATTERQSISYQSLYHRVCQIANAFKAIGLQKGDVLGVFLSYPLDNLIAMLACVRLGVVHAVIDAQYSAERLHECISHAHMSAVLTHADLKRTVDQALEAPNAVTQVLVMAKQPSKTPWNGLRDIDFDSLASQQLSQCAPVPVGAEDPCFIIYTIDDHNVTEGLCYTTGGYALYALSTFQLIFEYATTDIVGCTEPVYSIAAHSYGVYGPLLRGATTALSSDNIATVLYTRAAGAQALSSQPLLRRLIVETGAELTLSSKKSCSVVTVWGQPASGGAILLSGAPIFGISAVIMEPNTQGIGALVIQNSWPGQARTWYGNHQGFKAKYLKQYPGSYSTGVQASQDQLGNICIREVD